MTGTQAPCSLTNASSSAPPCHIIPDFIDAIGDGHGGPSVSWISVGVRTVTASHQLESREVVERITILRRQLRWSLV